MKSIKLSLVAAMPLVALSTQAHAERGTKIENSYICVFNKHAVSKDKAKDEAEKSVKIGGGQLKHVYSTVLRGFSTNMSAAGIENARNNNPNIAYCEQDQVVTAGQLRGNARPGGGGSVQPAQETPWGITRVGGGGAGTFATAWVIDTGIDLSHPDLNVDTARSRSFLGGTTTPADQNGHGTHVAGTIAARNNSIGVIGVAPGARVVAVRVLDRRGSGSNSGVIAGVDYVAANGQPGDVANMSLGGGVSAALDTAVVNAAAGGIRSRSPPETRATTPTTTRRRAPMGRTCSPSRRSPPATASRAFRTTATRRSTTPSPVRRSSRPGSTAATTPSAAPRWRRRISPACCSPARSATAAR